MKKTLRFMFTESLIVAGFGGAFVGVIIGMLVAEIVSVGVYHSGAVPLLVTLVSVITPIFFFSFMFYAVAAFHAWATND